jgi:glucan phosphoethanolaminetransferase (alkaline phosphatase superfamily)
MNPTCGTTSPVATAILDIFNNRRINPAGEAAARNYLQTQLNPIAESIRSEISSDVAGVVIMLVFIVVFSIFIFILWICYELNVEKWTVLVIVILLIVMTVIVYLIVFINAEASVDMFINELTIFVNQTIDPQIALDVTNNAFQEYLQAVGAPPC